MKLKIGRKVYEVTDKDIILDNKACYQIITIKDYQGTSLRIPKKLFELKTGAQSPSSTK